MTKTATIDINKGYREQYGFAKPEKYVFKTRKGLDEGIIKEISHQKGEPEWMRQFRLRAYEIFKSKKQPMWGADLSKVNYDNIYYYLRPLAKQGTSWADLPAEIRDTYDKIGIPEAEKKYLGGVGAQYDSEVIYHSLRKDLEKKGVILYKDVCARCFTHTHIDSEFIV